MMKLGIIGAENSHCAAIAKMLNVERLIKGFAVTHVWGETEQFAKAAAEQGKIPTIVADPKEMLGQIDCVMVDHRHGKFHLAAAMPFVKAGLPVFVDKPLSTSLAEAKRFLAFAKSKKVPVATFSAVPFQASVAAIKAQLKEINPKVVHFNGPGNPKSPYGGVFFYGIHQAELLVELLGTGAIDVTAVALENGMTCIVRLAGGQVATIGMPGVGDFSVASVGEKGGFHQKVAYDANTYMSTTKMFTKMFKTGKAPFEASRMLAPIALLEAIDKSLATGKTVKVASVG